MSASTKTGTQKPQKPKRPPFHEEFANKIIEHLQEAQPRGKSPGLRGKPCWLRTIPLPARCTGA